MSMKRLVPSLLFTCLWDLELVTGVCFFKHVCIECCSAGGENAGSRAH